MEQRENSERSLIGSLDMPAEAQGPPALSRELQLVAITTELTEKLRQTAYHLVDSGRLLIQAKRLVGHGRFRAWLGENFSMSAKTATRLMSVAQMVDRHQLDDPTIAKLTSLDLKTLYELAAKSTPLSVQKEMIQQLEQKREVSYELIRTFKRESQLQDEPAPEAGGELSGFTHRVQRLSQWIESHQATLTPSNVLDAHTRQELHTCTEKLKQASALIESILLQAEKQVIQISPVQAASSRPEDLA